MSVHQFLVRSIYIMFSTQIFTVLFAIISFACKLLAISPFS